MHHVSITDNCKGNQ